ncbi:MAG: NUDIX hydrolase [Alkaliphilus sp.]
MKNDENTMKSERIFEGKVINLRIDTVELPGRKYARREIVEHSGGVCILAITSDDEIIFVKQYRKAVEKPILEIPAGRIEEDESPELTAARELKEETGFSSSKITKVMQFYSSPGFTNEKIHLFLAENLEEGDPDFDENEYIEIVKINVKEAINMVKEGVIKDSKTIIALLYYQNNHLK